MNDYQQASLLFFNFQQADGSREVQAQSPLLNYQSDRYEEFLHLRYFQSLIC